MSPRISRRLLAKTLATAAAGYQAEAVIPHCTQCARPCCKLESLVLDLEWKQIRLFWRLDESRQAFDHRLAQGNGPVEIREAGGRYYVHGKACPAYDTAAANCRVYGQAIKPPGCTDFPVYEDEGGVIADLRCEAVGLEALVAGLASAVGPGYRIVRSPDRDFPFLVTLLPKRVAG